MDAIRIQAAQTSGLHHLCVPLIGRRRRAFQAKAERSIGWGDNQSPLLLPAHNPDLGAVLSGMASPILPKCCRQRRSFTIAEPNRSAAA